MTEIHQNKIPATIVSGFLGSGKTTLLKHIVQNNRGLKIAVVVNDIAELNIDAKVLDKTVKRTGNEAIIRLQNGCICCSRRVDFLKEIKELAINKEFNYLVIEGSGISQPIAIADSFASNIPGMENYQLSSVTKLDTMVTLVDASTFLHYLNSIKVMKEIDSECHVEESTPVTSLLIDQIEFANIIVLNKIDLVSKEDKNNILQVLRLLNHSADLLETSYSKVSLKNILNSGKFEFQKCMLNATWLALLQKRQVQHFDDISKLTTFIYKKRIPFHPHRLFHSDLKKYFGYGEKKIVRSKGFAWIASKNDTVIDWSQSGIILNLEFGGKWYVSIPEDDWLLNDDEIDNVRADFHQDANIGDRRQEIVFLGLDIDVCTITEILDNCLLTDAEFAEGIEAWKEYNDPFPKWKDEDDDFDSILCFNNLSD